MDRSIAKVPPILDYKVDVRSLPEKGHPVRIRSNAEECAALSSANDLVSVERFEADLLVEGWRADGVRVSGTFSADVVQECVTTLQPIEAKLDERIDATLVPDGSMLAHEGVGELVLDPDGDDPPETFRPPHIDVGGLVAEFFTLALDPYPRAPDAELPEEARDEQAAGPFAGLAALQQGS